MKFVGRDQELATLTRLFGQIRNTQDPARPGRCVLLRGRRRIGKSSLVEEFLLTCGAPAVYFTAAAASEAIELAEFTAALAESTLPDREVFTDAAPGNWAGALRLLATALPSDQPSVVVLDEVPYLMDTVDAFEGLLQRAWDRDLSRKPVLLILIGSDLSMMEALNSYGRPFHQRGQEMVIGPLSPFDVARMLQLEAAEALDAALVTGGLPLICASWTPGSRLWEFLADALADPVSPLLVSAERSLAAEFPEQTHARLVLAAIGSGERTFTNIQRAAGGIAASTLTRAVDLLVNKRMVAAELPVSLRPSKERRYRLTDPYLRFWLTFLGPHMPEIERRRGDLALARIRRGFTSWRGRAIEPMAREALARLLPDEHLPETGALGGYWTRSNDVEIDIVGADRAPVARRLLFCGSVKWLDNAPFDAHDLAALHRHRAAVTDQPVPLIAVSRSGVTCHGLDAAYGPADLLKAWTPA